MKKHLTRYPVNVHALVFVLIFATIGIYFILNSSAQVRTYYVSEAGSDTNAGTQAAPFRTINKALNLSTGGETIQVTSGTYAPISDDNKRSAPVTVIGVGATKPVIDGTNATQQRPLVINGATNVTFKNLKFIGQSSISDDVFHKAGAAYITLEGNELTGVNAGGNCITIRSNANNVLIKNNFIHDCSTGLGGPNYDDKGGAYNVHHVTVQGNTLRNFTADAIQFCDWDDVVFDRNDVQFANDPRNITHNDILQFTGNSHRVRITNNILAHSGHGQIILVQGAFGPISDVLIRNNLIYDSGAVAVQIQGSTNTRFISNVVWKGGLGGLLVRKDGYGNIVPTDMVIVNNILSAYGEDQMKPAVRSHNFIRNYKGTLLTKEKTGTDPGFVDATKDNYHLLSNSPMVDSGSSQYEADSFDQEGRARYDSPQIANTGTGPQTFFDIGPLEYGVASQSGAAGSAGGVGSKQSGQSATSAKGVSGAAANGAAGSSDASGGRATAVVKLSAISAKSNADGSVLITWQTVVSANSTVTYGLTPKPGLIIRDDKAVTQHSVTIPAKQLMRGVIYNYTVASGASTSQVQKFVTHGSKVQIVVHDKRGKALKKVPVILGSQQGITDSEGRVTFENVAVGQQAVRVNKEKSARTISVKGISSNSDTPQEFTLTASQRTSSFVYIGVLLVFAAITGGIVVVRNRFLPQPLALSETPGNLRTPDDMPSSTLQGNESLQPGSVVSPNQPSHDEKSRS